ncbi:hypothetical protein Aduo_007222 [Ancylostoma duodenale]
MTRIFLIVLVLAAVVPSSPSQEPAKEARSSGPKTPKKKKDITSYSDADLERLYEQWEENDDEKLDDDELPEHKRSPNTMDLDSIKAKAKNPEELLSMTKKGQTLMMFVNIRDPSNPLEKNRPFTSKYTEIFQSMLRNNHIICQVFLIDDDRAIFMFNDGSQAFEAKNFLLKQIQVTEVSLEGQQYVGAGAAKKDEL